MQAVQQMIQTYPIDLVCRAMDIGRASVYRALSRSRARRSATPEHGRDPGQPADLALGTEECNTRGSAALAPAYSPAPDRSPRNPARPSFRALSQPERDALIHELDSVRFLDRAPAQVYATLLDEGVYIGSVSTMYRLLRQAGQVHERRQRAHRAYARPELLATAPNQLWSWDITKLRGPAKWTYYYLYVILDVFSRYVVGWMVAHQENAALAEQLIEQACRTQGIVPGQLTIHADRGSAMTSKSVALLLSDLGVEKTHSRPHVSNDNPYSEAQFKTLKYAPGFPDRFGAIEDARTFSGGFFDWYNHHHRHSGIAMLTPADVHYGRAGIVLAARSQVLMAAYHQHPERFVRKPPSPASLPKAVWINPPSDLTGSDTTKK